MAYNYSPTIQKYYDSLLATVCRTRITVGPGATSLQDDLTPLDLSLFFSVHHYVYRNLPSP
jgi:hypothetical protein